MTSNRATTPQDALESTPAPLTFPQPKFKLGDKVVYIRAKDWWRGEYLRHLVSFWRNVSRDEPRRDRSLGTGGKTIIREVMRVFDQAEYFYVVGIHAEGMHVRDYVANTCYFNSGQCHDGISYEYQLAAVAPHTQTSGRPTTVGFHTGLPVAGDYDLKLFEEIKNEGRTAWA